MRDAASLSVPATHNGAGSAAGRSIAVRQMEDEAPETLPASLEPEGTNVFQEIDRHLLIVAEAAAALVDSKTWPEVRSTVSAPLAISEVAIPSRNERSASTPRGSELQFLFGLIAQSSG
jgi:hypothetical protein